MKKQTTKSTEEIFDNFNRLVTNGYSYKQIFSLGFIENIGEIPEEQKQQLLKMFENLNAHFRALISEIVKPKKERNLQKIAVFIEMANQFSNMIYSVHPEACLMHQLIGNEESVHIGYVGLNYKKVDDLTLKQKNRMLDVNQYMHPVISEIMKEPKFKNSAKIQQFLGITFQKADEFYEENTANLVLSLTAPE